MANAPDLQGYVEVKDRIVTFREKHPEGCLRPVNPEQPYSLELLRVGEDELCYIVYAAAAYRSPTDPMPGIGVAWEPFPGRTPYTRNSELMNAETSAWGRAIVAALAADAGPVATAEDVKRRRDDGDKAAAKVTPKPGPGAATEPQIRKLHALAKDLGRTDDDLYATASKRYSVEHLHQLTKAQASEMIEGFQALLDNRAGKTRKDQTEEVAAALTEPLPADDGDYSTEEIPF